MRPNSSLSRLKQQYQNLGLHSVKSNKTQQELPTKEELIKKKDFSNAIILLEEDKILYKENLTHQLWLAYCYYHNGDLE